MLRLPKILNSIRFFSNISPSRYVLEPLENRSLLRIAGGEVKDFLQGLITNDINHLGNTLGGSMYTLLLNNKGRVTYDAIIYRSNEVNTFLVECDDEAVDKLVQHLKIYRVRRKIDIDVLKNEFKVHVLFCSDNIKSDVNDNTSREDFDGIIVPCDKLKSTIPETSTSTTIYKDLLIFRDPRVTELGSRIISKSSCDVMHQISEIVKVVDPPQPHENYKLLRYSLGVGEGIKDLPPDNCFPLECNCDYLHGVSFHKGCYIGQELTARTHHTGVVRKRLMPLYFTKIPTNLPSDNVILHAGKRLGKLRGVEGHLGLALLRVADALDCGELMVGNGVASVQRPQWWPIEATKKKENLQKS